MSHTSQRRGLDPNSPGKGLVVLAMVPAQYKDREGVGAAMSELALKMLEHHPDNWLARNFTEITIPDLGPAQGPVTWAGQRWPGRTERLLMRGLGYLSSVVTAVYADPADVVALINDLQGEWLARNREAGLPISIVLSGLFDDTHECCQRTGTSEHTYLASLGFFGKVSQLPSATELEIITMCGHGLIAANRVRYLVERIKSGAMTAREAAEDVARPCVCGIVNRARAEEIFERLSE